MKVFVVKNHTFVAQVFFVHVTNLHIWVWNSYFLSTLKSVPLAANCAFFQIVKKACCQIIGKFFKKDILEQRQKSDV